MRGAKAAGATEIVVMDCHGAGKGWTFNSLIPEDLDPACEFVVQDEWTEYTEFLEEGCDAALFVGMHCARRHRDGVMNHTISGRDFQNLWFNGTLVGETGINAALCGTWGCPVLLVTGDDASCREGTELLGAGLTTVVGQARLQLVQRTQPHARTSARAHRSGARSRRSSNLSAVPPYDPGSPCEIKVEYKNTNAAHALRYPSWRRAPRRSHDRLARRHVVGGLDAVLLLSRSVDRRLARDPRLRDVRGGRGRTPDPDPRLRDRLRRPRRPRRHRVSRRVLRGRGRGRAATTVSTRFGRLVRLGPENRPQAQLALLGLDPGRRHRARDHARGHRPRRRDARLPGGDDRAVAQPSAKPGRPATSATCGRSTGPPTRRYRLVDGDEELAAGRDAARDARSLAGSPLAPRPPARDGQRSCSPATRSHARRSSRAGINGGASDASAARRSAERLLELARRHDALLVYGHDPVQANARCSRRVPTCYR